MKSRIALALCAGSLLASQAHARTQEQPAAPAPADAAAAYREMVRASNEARPPAWPDDRPARVRTLFRSDYDERRFFNRAGATRAQFDGEWEECRQISRRLASSAGSVGVANPPGFYPTNLTSAVGGAIGMGLVGMFEGAFAQRRAEEAVRRHCLMTRGWRMVEPDEAHRQRINDMSRADRNAYLDRMLGATEVQEARIVSFESVAAEAAEAAAAKPAPGEQATP